MQRRDFIKGSCKLCLLGAAGFAFAAESCSPKAMNGIHAETITAVNNTALVPISVLRTDSYFTVIDIKQYPFEIAVEKKEDNSYRTLLLMCTHQDNPLTPTGAGYTCSVHGSRFTKEGKVVNGPAEQSLHELKTTIQDAHLLIQLEKI